MRFYTSLALLLAVTFGLGVLVGDNYAPISNRGSADDACRQAKWATAALETKVLLLNERVLKLEADAKQWRSRLGVLFGEASTR